MARKMEIRDAANFHRHAAHRAQGRPSSLQPACHSSLPRHATHFRENPGIKARYDAPEQRCLYGMPEQQCEPGMRESVFMLHAKLCIFMSGLNSWKWLIMACKSFAKAGMGVPRLG